MTSRNDKSGTRLTQNKIHRTRSVRVYPRFYTHRHHSPSPLVPTINRKGNQPEQASVKMDISTTAHTMEGLAC